MTGTRHDFAGDRNNPDNQRQGTGGSWVVSPAPAFGSSEARRCGARSPTAPRGQAGIPNVAAPQRDLRSKRSVGTNRPGQSPRRRTLRRQKDLSRSKSSATISCQQCPVVGRRFKAKAATEAQRRLPHVATERSCLRSLARTRLPAMYSTYVRRSWRTTACTSTWARRRKSIALKPKTLRFQ